MITLRRTALRLRAALLPRTAFLPRAALPAVAAVALAACATGQLPAGVAGADGAAAHPFATEEDPELAAAALPALIKLSETRVRQIPADPQARLAAGRLLIAYAGSFVHGAAELLPAGEYGRRAAVLQRAKRLHLRGLDYVLSGLEMRRPGTLASVAAGRPAALLGILRDSDADFAFWVAAGWLGALAADPGDVDLLLRAPIAGALLGQVLRWDDAYGGGRAHEAMIRYLGGLPETAGGDRGRARQHFLRAMQVSGGTSAAACVNLAVAVAVAEQDVDQFRRLLTRALAIDVDAAPERRLQNVLAQRRARHLLDRTDDLFPGASAT